MRAGGREDAQPGDGRIAFRAGDAVETALQTALIPAICLKFDEQLTSRPPASLIVSQLS